LEELVALGVQRMKSLSLPPAFPFTLVLFLSKRFLRGGSQAVPVTRPMQAKYQ
jgi:hypothetical protein